MTFTLVVSIIIVSMITVNQLYSDEYVEKLHMGVVVKRDLKELKQAYTQTNGHVKTLNIVI